MVPVFLGSVAALYATPSLHVYLSSDATSPLAGDRRDQGAKAKKATRTLKKEKKKLLNHPRAGSG